MPKPWEQQKGETDKAYTAFLVFRNMEPEKRTLKDAYNLAYNKPAVGPHRRHASGQWKTWHDNWQWRERADAWDAEQYRKEEAALEKERIKYKVRACRQRLELADAQLKNQLRKVQRELKLSQGQDVDKHDYTKVKYRGQDASGNPIWIERKPITELVNDGVAATNAAIQIQRVEFGEPSDITEQRHTDADGSSFVDKLFGEGAPLEKIESLVALADMAMAAIAEEAQAAGDNGHSNGEVDAEGETEPDADAAVG